MWIGGSSKIARTAKAVVRPESPVWFRLRRLRIPARAPLGREGPPKNRATRWPIARNHDKKPTRKAGSHMKGRSHMNDKTTNKRGEVSTSMSCRPHPGKHLPIPSRRDWAVTGLVTLVALCLGVLSPALADPKPKIKFDMMRSAAATNANCAADATG